MPTVNANGASLEYQESGSGEPIVMVHGGLSDHRIWEAQREALGRNYRAIAYSCRYNWPGGPVPPDAEPSFMEHVDDLQALVTALDAAPAHLVGNSSGGLLSLLVATRAPEQVRSLVLLEPFVLPIIVGVPPRPVKLLRLALRHPRTAAAIVAFGARGLAPTQAAFERGDLDEGLRIFTLAVLGARGVEQMTEARREQARDNLEAFASELTRGTFPSPDPEAVRQITVPTLLICAEQSPPIMRLMTNRLHELLPHAERVEIPCASHDAHVDNPSAVTDAVLTFLARGSNALPAA